MPEADVKPLPEIATASFVLVTGKGGVGKSTVAAAIAWQLAEAGRRVLLIEVDPREALHELLGIAPSGGACVTVRGAVDRERRGALSLQSLRPRQVVDREIESRIPLSWVARRVLASPIYHHFVDGAPGLEQLAVLEHVRRQLSGACDVVVLDAAATGHALAQLRAPRLVAEAVRSGPFARLAARLASLVADRGHTRVVLVTQAEEMAMEETRELAASLRDELGQEPALLVLNQLLGTWEGGGRKVASPASSLWLRRRELQQEQLHRLATEWHGSWRELPALALPRGPELVAALASALVSATPQGGERER